SGTGPFESARVSLTGEGRIVLAAGSTSLGQGLATTLAQVCAEVLQVSPADIGVHLGDTRWMPHGVGSSASRSAVMAGSGVPRASRRLREQITAVAARHFEASAADIELDNAAAVVRGVPDRRCSLREIAALAGGGLDAEWRHETTRALGSFGVHLSLVRVDAAPGRGRPQGPLVPCAVGGGAQPGRVERPRGGGAGRGRRPAPP